MSDLMDRMNCFNSIKKNLAVFAVDIDLSSSLNLLEKNRHAEISYLHLFNNLYGFNLKATKVNETAIDLIDNTNKIIVQVSSTATKEKVESALTKDLSAYVGYTFKFISISKPASALRKIVYNIPSGLKFDPHSDIYDHISILKDIFELDFDAQQHIAAIVEKEFGTGANLCKLESNGALVIKATGNINNLSLDSCSKDIYLFYMGREFQQYYHLIYLPDSLLSEFIFATKISLLLCKNKIIIPPSSLTECNYASSILDEFKIFKDYICFSDSESNSILFREKKVNIQFKHNNIGIEAYKANLSERSFLKKYPFSDYGRWSKRKHSKANIDIKRSWCTAISGHEPAFDAFEKELWGSINDSKQRAKLQSNLNDVPERLENKAFIAEFVIDTLPIKAVNPKTYNNLRRTICQYYIASYLDEHDACCINEFSGDIDVQDIIPVGYEHISLQKIRMSLTILGLRELFEQKMNEETVLNSDVLFRLRMAESALSKFRTMLNTPLEETVFSAGYRRITSEYIRKIKLERQENRIGLLIEMIEELFNKMSDIMRWG